MSLGLEVDKCKEHLKTVYGIAHEFDVEELKDPALYLSAMEDLCNIVDTDSRCTAANALAMNRTTNVEEFDRIYNEELSNQKKTNPKKTAPYKQFIDSLRVIKDEANVEYLVTEAEINVLDPLSKKRMQNPVKNQLCGHHYEKLTVLEVIKTKDRFRCPVAGCGNRAFITKSHLQDDIEFRKQLTRSAHCDSDD